MALVASETEIRVKLPRRVAKSATIWGSVGGSKVEHDVDVVVFSIVEVVEVLEVVLEEEVKLVVIDEVDWLVVVEEVVVLELEVALVEVVLELDWLEVTSEEELVVLEEVLFEEVTETLDDEKEEVEPEGDGPWVRTT